VLGGFAVFMVVWLLSILLFSCGFDPICHKAEVRPLGTPISPVVSARISHSPNQNNAGKFNKCQVRAMDLLGAWVDAGSPETESFEFTDISGAPCTGTYAEDIAPLMVDSQVWFHGSLSCTTCHNSALGKESAGLNLSSYVDILAGSQRASADQATGNDIFGGGNWASSLLYQSLTQTDNVPLGHPSADRANSLIVYAGQPAP